MVLLHLHMVLGTRVSYICCVMLQYQFIFIILNIYKQFSEINAGLAMKQHFWHRQALGISLLHLMELKVTMCIASLSFSIK